MHSIEQFPPSEMALRDEIMAATAQRLESSYFERESKRFKIALPDAELLALRVGAGSAAWPATACLLDILQELAIPGYFGSSCEEPTGETNLVAELQSAAHILYVILHSYFGVEFEEAECRERAVHATLNLIARLPDFRERARWNIFASLKDPAVWDSFVLRNESRSEDLGKLDLLGQVDHAIRARERSMYVEFLKEHGFDYVYDYQMRLVKRSYPGWRALLLHDIMHALALGGESEDGRVSAGPTPFLPRTIAHQAAILYQTDLHPEARIGDANFIDHPHHGVTMGQTGKIGIGCVLYPCTLGGVTDKVKPRHPLVGDFVLIGTGVGLFGVVEVGDGSVVGANSEIYGYVRMGLRVRIGSAVVARTVKPTSGKLGKLIFNNDCVVGEGSLIINDQPSDLTIPAKSVIPAQSHIVNDGFGNPRMV